MTAHDLYVAAAYGVSGVTLAGLIGGLVWDYRARRRELAVLGAAGVRRRSEKQP